MKIRYKSVSVFIMVLLFSGSNLKTYADNSVSNETTTGSAIQVTNPLSSDTSTQTNNVGSTTTSPDTTGTTSTPANTDTSTTTPDTNSGTNSTAVDTGATTTPSTGTTTVPTVEPITDPSLAPTISVSVSTSSLDFGNVNSVSDNELPYLTVTVQSNSKYQLAVSSTGDFKGDDNSHSMSIDHLKVKLRGEKTFKNMKKTPVVLIDNQPSTDSKTYNVEFKLNPDWKVKSGKYGTSIMFEVEAIQ